MIKKILLIIFFVVLTISIIAFYKNNSISQTNAKLLSPDKEANISKKNVIQETLSPIKDKTKKISTVIKDTNYNIEEEIQLYKILSIAEAKLTVMPRKNIDPIEAISVKNTDLGVLQVNDKIILPNIEGADYTLIISSTQTHQNGSRTATGKFEDEGIMYTTTITTDEKDNFIALATPRGLYEIETQDDIGYIYKTNDIRKHLQKEGISDVIILPIPSKPTPK